MASSLGNASTESCQMNNDPDSRFQRVQLLLERAVFACSQIIAFSEEIASMDEYSPDALYRFKMMPTEMIVAMHNVRTGIENGLMWLATLALPPDIGTMSKEFFIDKKEGEENADLGQLFQQVVEKGGPKGFLPVGKIQLPSDSGVDPEEYQGSLDYIQEMAEKYQFYDFENVPKGMAGACRKRDQVVNPFATGGDQNESCSHLQNPQPAHKTIDPDEVVKYRKMCQELIEDANIVFGQFGAVGSICKTSVQDGGAGQ